MCSDGPYGSVHTWWEIDRSIWQCPHVVGNGQVHMAVSTHGGKWTGPYGSVHTWWEMDRSIWQCPHVVGNRQVHMAVSTRGGK